ncbi:MAG TPA: histidine kinase N-terminal 7TM domain-containing protein, partial [Syntrophales bacterium]|nr:histidine kinase N-terminal 7TM domain-containing protein [Syntrophales bacterium]
MNIYLVPPALGFVVFLCLVLAALFKGSRRPAELLFAGFCLSGALINLDIILVSAIPDKATALQVDRTIYIFFVFSIPLYIRFIHVFLGESRPWLDGAALAVSILFLVFTRSDYFISGLNEYSFGRIARAGPLYHAFCFAGAMASVYCLVMLFKALRETEEGRQRNRLKFIIVGMGMSAFLLLLNYLPINGFSIYPMGNFVFVPAVIMAFGVLKYDLFDVDAAIRKGMVYFFLTGTIMVIYAFLFYILDIFFREFARSHILFSPFVLALTVIFLFDPVRKGVERFTDKHFFSGKYDYRRTLKEISEEMTLLLRYEDIRRFLVTSIENTVQVEDVRLVVPRDDDERSRAVWGNRVIVDVLERQKAPISKGSSVISRLADGERKAFERLFEVCGAVILFPVIFRGRLNGLITLGPKKSGELFVQEDLELLSTVANQCAVALENARAYEELQELNANLEGKVRERTAELERALREKENAQNRLIQSERLAAIGQLAAGVAHEINNPL